MSCAYTRTDIYWVPVHRVVPFACSVTYGTKLISIPCERREITIVRAFRIGSGSPETLLGRWWLLLTASRWSCNWRLMGHRVFAITRVYTLAINAPCFPTSLEDFSFYGSLYTPYVVVHLYPSNVILYLSSLTRVIRRCPPISNSTSKILSIS